MDVNERNPSEVAFDPPPSKAVLANRKLLLKCTCIFWYQWGAWKPHLKEVLLNLGFKKAFSVKAKCRLAVSLEMFR